MSPVRALFRDAFLLSFTAYDSFCSVRTAAPAPAGLFDEVLAAAERVRALLDLYDPGSELSRLNASPAGTDIPVSGELADILSRALRFCRASGGAFDITTGSLSRLYGFGTDRERAPRAEELARARAGYRLFTLDENRHTARFTQSGVVLDAGGLGKGCAAEAIARVCEGYGADDCVISLGGSLTVNLGPERAIGVEDPSDPSAAPLVRLRLPGGMCASTSAANVRFFSENGKIYHHILDPHTRLPADSGIVSVTVIAPDPTAADILSTACFAGGIGALKGCLPLCPGAEACVIFRDGTCEVPEHLLA